MKTLVKCDWTESERGWGMRPDGISLHITSQDQKAFVKEYWDSMPDDTPDEYSFPGSTSLVEVEDSLYNEVSKSENGVRYFRTPKGIL